MEGIFGEIYGKNILQP
jgi:hypothetical protein